MKWFVVLSALLCLVIIPQHVFGGDKSSSGLAKFFKKVAKSKTVKILEKGMAIWAPSDIITLIISAFEEEPLDQFIGVNTKLDDIALKLDDLERQIETSTLKILSEVNFARIKEIEATINSAPSKLVTMIAESGNDKTVFLSKLDRFIEAFGYPTNMEYTLVQYLNTGGRSSASLMGRFVDVVKDSAKDNFCQLKSSANAMIFEFHISIMNSVLKLTTLLGACYRAKDQISRSNLYFPYYYARII